MGKSEGLLAKHNCPFSARITVRFEPAGCPLSLGIGVRFQQESLSALVRNWCPLCARTSVRFAQYFANIKQKKRALVGMANTRLFEAIIEQLRVIKFHTRVQITFLGT